MLLGFAPLAEARWIWDSEALDLRKSPKGVDEPILALVSSFWAKARRVRRLRGAVRRAEIAAWVIFDERHHLTVFLFAQEVFDVFEEF